MESSGKAQTRHRADQGYAQSRHMAIAHRAGEGQVKDETGIYGRVGFSDDLKKL